MEASSKYKLGGLNEMETVPKDQNPEAGKPGLNTPNLAPETDAERKCVFRGM
jgi:hypothetical protein